MIVCRSPIEIEKLRRVNQLVARILAELRPMVAPGVTTKEIDGSAEALVRKAGAEPAFKGYHGYPATVCASINEQVVHGIPSARRLVEGDVLSLDMGAKLDGFFGDCAVTLPVGRVSADAATLLRVTEEALFHGIDVVQAGRACIGHWRSGPAARRSARFLGRARVRRARDRDCVARGAADRQLRAERTRAAAVGGNGAGDRADGERGQAAR